MATPLRQAALRRGAALASAGLAVLAVAGCDLKDREPDLVNGKQLYAEKCGTCHVLRRADTRGVTGPNLDAAFARSRRDGLGEDTVRELVQQQILYPRNDSSMPAKLVTGRDADDVAAYVAEVAGQPGEDRGALADAGQQKAEGTATAKGGTLDIPTSESGLTYEFADARAEAGRLEVTSKNPQSVDHNIAVDGQGIDVKGNVVQNGGVSRLTVTLKPGKYAFYCSVPGHREGGMEGELTVR